MPRQRPGFIDDMRRGFNVSTWFLQSWSLAYLPFLRVGFGVRGMEQGFWALLLILAYGCLAESPAMLFYYLPAWLLAVVWKRLRANPMQHSSYHGWPMLTGWLIPNNEYLARCAEAGLLLPLGALLSFLDERLAAFVALGAIPLIGSYLFSHALHLRRVRAAMDWQAEAEHWQSAMQDAARRQRRGR